MQREELITMMVKLLGNALRLQGSDDMVTVDASAALVGPHAVLTSLGLVSFITDCEAEVAEIYDVELSLVNENALSRRNSPFRTVETLADYALELVRSGVDAGR